MGGTKVKVIDDSIQEDEKKVVKKTVRGNSTGDLLIDKLNQELGVETAAVEPKEEGKDSKKEVKVKSESKKEEGGKASTIKNRSKRYLEAAKELDKAQMYPLAEAIELSKKVSYSKFPGTLEIHINTSSKNIRGLVTLPYASGKKLKILAFGKGALESGADIVGDENKLKEIARGKIDFDVLVTDPSWMPRLAPMARILGPRGLMPNPKNGTVTDNLAKAVAELQAGKTEYKTDRDGRSIHLAIGKTSQESAEIAANIKALHTAIGKSRIKKLVITPTMGAGVKVSLNSI